MPCTTIPWRSARAQAWPDSVPALVRGAAKHQTAFFSAATLSFLRDLAANNNRDWFALHKGDYEACVRDPFLRLIEAMQPHLAQISPHFRADPKPNGGSLFRIYRDARFSNDKSPYKPWAGARFFHERAKQTPAPSFYLHIAPDDCFVGAGIWHPEPDAQRKIRNFLVENPNSWISATQSPAFSNTMALGGDSAVRAPRGFDAHHPLIADIRRKDFVAFRPLSNEQICHSGLVSQLSAAFIACAHFVDYLCAALELEF
jgi:uncharacterized protein (TIGR02453 family)